jgi:prepilin-type processing-associated H-X9-DG protein
VAAVTDGTSHTILVGEKSMDVKNYDTGTWYNDEPFFTGGSGGTFRWGDRILQDARNIVFEGNWGSDHTGGAQFLFADGSVHLLNYATAPDVMAGLLTPSGGEVVLDF